jgi:alpha-glucosidase
LNSILKNIELNRKDMNAIQKVLTFISVLFLFSQVDAQKTKTGEVMTVLSPDGKIRVEINRGVDSKLYYKIEADGKDIITPSRLGIVTDNVDLGSDFSFGGFQMKGLKETYPVFGSHSIAINNCNIGTFEIHTKGENWFLDVRVFNDGVGIRSRLPAKKNRLIQAEATEWKVPSKTLFWYQNDLVAYEGTFSKSLVDTIPAERILALPVTALMPSGKYVMITEASLVDYSDLALKSSGDIGLKAFFHAEQQGWNTDDEVNQPWRVTLIANDLNTLVNSDIVHNLCPAPSSELANATWIKPGRAAWNWWSTPTLIYNQQHQWVDYAKQLGFEYYLIDAGWNRWKDGDKTAWDCLTEVAGYANSVGIKLWIWVHSNEVTKEADRTRIFDNAVKAGISGIKIDFVPKSTRERSNWYEATLREAASDKLMIDFHGAVKPTGRERTWPNELTREAIRGHEYQIIRYKRTLLPDHDCTLPFNRFVQGFGDYTPTVFNPAELLGYTWPREIAQAIVFTSPFLCYADNPENYLKNPALDILKAIPSTWDETIVLKDSEIGKCAAFARRKGNTWFIGVINGSEKKDIDIPLSFLKVGTYTMNAYEDDANRGDGIVKKVSKVSKSDHIMLSIRTAGGFVAQITQ